MASSSSDVKCLEASVVICYINKIKCDWTIWTNEPRLCFPYESKKHKNKFVRQTAFHLKRLFLAQCLLKSEHIAKTKLTITSFLLTCHSRLLSIQSYPRGFSYGSEEWFHSWSRPAAHDPNEPSSLQLLSTHGLSRARLSSWAQFHEAVPVIFCKQLLSACLKCLKHKDVYIQKQHRPWWSSLWFLLSRTPSAGHQKACLVFLGPYKIALLLGWWLQIQLHWNPPQHHQCFRPQGTDSSQRAWAQMV